MRSRTFRPTLLLAAAALALSGCSLLGGPEKEGKSNTEATEGAATPGPVVLLTHDSFNLPKKLVKQWEAETGNTLEIRGSGDAGTLASKISLSAGNPQGDVVFGIDNTFASRPIESGALEASDVDLAPGADTFALAEGSDLLKPIDTGSVCVNVDTTWFKANKVRPPVTLLDLTKPAYRGLFVTPGASTSSPGMAFFLATVAQNGDGWQDYWKMLMANDTLVVDGWEDAYFGDFTQGGAKGTRPIVTSYDSSPAFTVKNGKSSTAALLDTCFRQVEYAGVLAGAKNPAGGAQLLQWLQSDEVQSALPESMYVFPVSSTATIPKDWAEFAEQPEHPLNVSPEEIAANREKWLTEWTDLVTR